MAVYSPEVVAADAAILLAAMAEVIRPAPDMRISEWAEGRVVIPGETGTERDGPLSWDGYEYLIEPLDVLGPDDPARDDTFVGSAQIAKTTIGVIATLYYSSVQPRSWGVALPSGDEVLKYNRSKWQPIVDATPELKRKIRPVSSRDEQGSTNTYKRFAGGYGQFFGAGSPKALQMVTYCLVVYEETPNWDLDVGGRGDPRSQIRKRQLRWELAGAKTFHNATPGLKRPKEQGAEETIGCPVTEDFEKGDQRRLYHPCPHCGDQDEGVMLRLDFAQMQGMGTGERPHFNCPGCGCEIDHRHKAGMVARCHPYKAMNGRRGGWLPTFASEDESNPAPGWFIKASDFDRYRSRPREGRDPSFHAWQVVSSAVDWHYIAKEWREAEEGGEAKKIAFSQQIKGEAYEISVQQADVDLLLEKRDGRFVRGVVPSWAELLTCAIDLNGDWGQWTVYAWGPGGEHVPIDKGRIDGSPAETELWSGISELIGRSYPHEDGGQVKLEATGLDSGFGTFYVYAFCMRFSQVLALDGASGWKLMPLRRGAKQRLKGDDGTVVSCRTWRVGTWDLKRELLNEVIPAGMADSGRASGRPHWPAWVERDFFEELTAEALVEVQDSKTGVMKAERWVRVRRRNEEMDLWVYNAALARSKGVGVPGSEPDWLELKRRRQGSQMGLEDLWSRPTSPATQQPETRPGVPAVQGGRSAWDWRPRTN